MHNFLPYWYVNKENNRINKRLKKYICILVLLDIILIGIICIRFMEMRKIDTSFLNISKKSNNAIENTFVKNDKVLKNLEQFRLIYTESLNISNVDIENNKIEFICNIKEYEPIIKLIENIELEKVFSIKYLSPLKENENGYNFKVILEVNSV
jgi:hypothetical protein